jgi:hypothetical protein
MKKNLFVTYFLPVFAFVFISFQSFSQISDSRTSEHTFLLGTLKGNHLEMTTKVPFKPGTLFSSKGMQQDAKMIVATADYEAYSIQVAGGGISGESGYRRYEFSSLSSYGFPTFYTVKVNHYETSSETVTGSIMEYLIDEGSTPTYAYYPGVSASYSAATHNIYSAFQMFTLYPPPTPITWHT